MKLFKYTLSALAVAVTMGLAACSDDVDHGDYAAGQKSPGAFFPDGLPETVEVDLDKSTFEVPVQRTGADAPAEYTVTLTDESGLFTAPSKISFDGSSLETSVVVTFDPEKVEANTEYPMELVINDATVYGPAKYAFNFVRQEPLVVEKAGPEGLGDYTYNGCYSGTDPELKVDVRYSPANPNKKTYIVHNWGNGSDLLIEMPDAEAIDANGHIPVYINRAYLGANSSSGQPIEYCSSYVFDQLTGGGDGKTLDTSYYIPETGLFMLENAYFYINGTSISWWGYNYETLQLYGYPDYSLEIEYSGMFTSVADDYTAICSLTSGADVAKIHVAASKELSTADLVDAIQAGSMEGVVEVSGSTEPQNVSLPVAEEGDYTVVAVGFDSKGNAQTFAETEFQLSFSGEAKWNALGETEMLDGWWGRFYFQDPMSAIIPVDIEQNPEDAAMLRTVGAFAIYDDNECKKAAKTTVVYDFTIPTTCFLVPQLSGFQNSAISSLQGVEPFIANQEGLFLANNEGITREFIVQYMASQGLDATTVEDGIMTLPTPLFSMDADSYYSWTNAAPTLLLLPQATDAAKAKAKAKAVAAPKYNGLRGASMHLHIGGKGKHVNHVKIALPANRTIR